MRPGVGRGEGVGARQNGLAVAAGELDRAGVSGGHVAIGVVGRDGDVVRDAPAVSVVGKPETASELAGAACTAMPVSLAVRPAWRASVAVIDWLPAVSRVTAKACDPASAAVKV